MKEMSAALREEFKEQGTCNPIEQVVSVERRLHYKYIVQVHLVI